MDWIEKNIEAIRKDRRHGATQLAANAVRVLVTLCQRAEAMDAECLARQVKETALVLASTRPSMAPIRNWCLVYAQRFGELTADNISFRELKRQGVILGKELLAQQQSFAEQQVQAARNLLHPYRSLVTLSYSSTIESILRHALPPHCRVRIAESRPLMEGRRLFSKVQDNVADLRIVTDAQLGLAIPTADLVLVGADAILRDTAVVNKAGTYLAALVARTHARDFVVAADTYKINVLADSQNCILESKSGSEVWRRQAKRCDNVYFDITPGDLVTGFLTEKGLVQTTGIKSYIEHWKRLARALDS